MKRLTIGIIYKITYPNGKIYVGQDWTNDINYFGSADSFTIAKDFTAKQRKDFIVRKEILLRCRNIPIADLNAHERRLIRHYQANDPAVGYNRTGVKRRQCTSVFLKTGRAQCK